MPAKDEPNMPPVEEKWSKEDAVKAGRSAAFRGEKAPAGLPGDVGGAWKTAHDDEVEKAQQARRGPRQPNQGRPEAEEPNEGPGPDEPDDGSTPVPGI